MMKALRLYGPMDLRLDEIEEPKTGPGQVKIRTECCGLCGSDKPRLLQGEVPFFPNTIGHEFSATVVETGEGVTSVREGDLVAAVPLIVCHQCAQCRPGHYGQCRHKQFIGLRVPDMGGFAEFNVLPEANVIKAPEGVDRVTAALIEPVSVAVHSLMRVGLKPASDVAVIGAGTIGLLIIRFARLMGARRIHVFDVEEHALSEAAQAGADYCYNTGDEGFFAQYMDNTNGLGCPTVMEAVGIQDTVMLATKLCRVGGSVALVGYLDRPIAFSAADMRRVLESELNLIGVWQSYDLDFPGDAWRLGLDYLASRMRDAARYIDRVIEPAQILQACRDWAAPGKIRGKIVVDMKDFNF